MRPGLRPDALALSHTTGPPSRRERSVASAEARCFRTAHGTASTIATRLPVAIGFDDWVTPRHMPLSFKTAFAKSLTYVQPLEAERIGRPVVPVGVTLKLRLARRGAEKAYKRHECAQRPSRCPPRDGSGSCLRRNPRGLHLPIHLPLRILPAPVVVPASIPCTQKFQASPFAAVRLEAHSSLRAPSAVGLGAMGITPVAGRESEAKRSHAPASSRRSRMRRNST